MRALKGQTPLPTIDGNVKGCSLWGWGIGMVIPQKIKLTLSYEPVTIPLGVDPKELKTETQKDVYSLLFPVVLYTVATG